MTRTQVLADARIEHGPALGNRDTIELAAATQAMINQAKPKTNTSDQASQNSEADDHPEAGRSRSRDYTIRTHGHKNSTPIRGAIVWSRGGAASRGAPPGHD